MFGIHCIKRGGQIPAFRVLELTEPDENADPMKTHIHPMRTVGHDSVMASDSRLQFYLA